MKQLIIHALEALALVGAMAAVTIAIWVGYALMNIPQDSKRCFAATTVEASYCKSQWRWE